MVTLLMGSLPSAPKSLPKEHKQFCYNNIPLLVPILPHLGYYWYDETPKLQSLREVKAETMEAGAREGAAYCLAPHSLLSLWKGPPPDPWQPINL